MSPHSLDEREFELINIIGAKISSNQRDLSHSMDLSLGSINMLIRRVIAKGYIRMKQLNKRKVEYILTPKGFAEKTRKSINYTLKTIRSIGTIKRRLSEIVSALYANGERSFVIIGNSDLTHLLEISLKQTCPDGYRVSQYEDIPKERVEGTFLICTERVQKEAQNSTACINLIEELARDHAFEYME